ncbi:MAG: hypothetical protein M1816_006184 [Peltula sp. TS41687]|nr:MAG: hypothetical protein M1816_006184 [Peltula sp. TS41687]
MSSLRPYEIGVPEKSLDLLKKKLSLASSFPDELEEAGWDLGAPLADVKRLTAYWDDGFDWRMQEKRLNDELPQYTTDVTVDGFGSLEIHLVHQRSDIKGAIPLLFVHGWPGSFLEVSKIISLLTKPEDGTSPAFNVVAPSLPNFGFSEGPKKRGFGIKQYAEVCHKVMIQLGYHEYVTQGGDFGFSITRALGILYPSACRGSHINMVAANPPSWIKHPLLSLQHAVIPYSDRDRKGIARMQWFQKEGRGYNVEQSTKPQTVGYGISDSPVGLLAWIYEKLHDWTDDYPWTDDEILTWISIYWFSRAGPAATTRIYYEVAHDPSKFREEVRKYVANVPLGLAYFPKELYVVPKIWGRTLGPVLYESDNDSGGHFAAWERPEIIVDDLRKMFGKKGGAYDVIKGRNGYGDLEA